MADLLFIIGAYVAGVATAIPAKALFTKLWNKYVKKTADKVVEEVTEEVATKKKKK